MKTNYYEKYIKYRTKYLNLKKKAQLTGGMGYNTKYWNEHPSFERLNRLVKDKILLLKDNNGNQYDLYSPLLDNLLKINNGIINMDFITDFHRYIHYDIDGTSVGINGGKWINNDDNKYIIIKTLRQAHGNTLIYFLESKDKRDNKVLKVFNNINLSKAGRLYGENITIDDYLSLEITLINDKIYNIPQTNYNVYSKDNFDKINFNMITKFIKTNDNNDLYLSCKNNDAINDYIMNLILQKINETTPINFVKYHNFFVTRINGELRYCILMDTFDGSVDNYINELKENSYEKIYNILFRTEEELNKLKTYEYLFTHTDMKLENIFYKKEKETIIPYLADFDKSSITFHNIRFYNDISQSSGLKSYAGSNTFIQSLLRDDYTIKKTTERIVNFNLANRLILYPDDETGPSSPAMAASASPEQTLTPEQLKEIAQMKPIIKDTSYYDKYEPFKYRLSRIGANPLSKLSELTIDTEQTYMRYNMTPYYTSFDMCSLLCSLFSKKKFIKIDDITLYKLVLKYISEDAIQDIINIYNELNIPLEKIGDFGYLMNPLLIQKKLIKDCFIHFFHKIINEPNPFINKLYKTNGENKIALSIPFYPLPMQVFNNITQFKLNIGETRKAYKDIKDETLIKFIDKLSNPNFNIEYNKDYAVGTTAIITLDKFIVKTNRYSSISIPLGGITIVYDYDEIEMHQIKQIFDFFKSITN